MSETAPTAVAPVATPVVETPAAPATTPAAAPKKQMTVAEARLARRAAESEPVVEEAKPEAKPETTTAEADLDEKALAQFSTLSKQNRAQAARIKELEARAALADKVDQATKLQAEGKHYEAIKLLGINFDDAARQVMQIPVTEAAVDPTIKALQEDITKLKATHDAQLKQEEARKAVEAASNREAGLKMIMDEVAKNATKYPHLALNPAWVKSALDEAKPAYEALVKEYERPLSGAELDRLTEAALAEGEARRAADAALYAKPGTNPIKPIPSIGRAGAVTPLPKQMTVAEAKRARRAAAQP